MNEQEKEWWYSFLIPSSDTCRGHRYVDCDDIPKIIAEASRRAVEKRDQEIGDMIQEEMNKSKEATKAAVLKCDDRDSIEEMKSEAKGESIAFHIILSKLT